MIDAAASRKLFALSELAEHPLRVDTASPRSSYIARLSLDPPLVSVVRLG
jgi:hypothetical protein